MKYRRIGLALVVPALVATACGSGGSSSSSSGGALAANQVFRFPITDDIKTLDPGHVSTAVDIAFVDNVFGGLYRIDDQLKEVPDIAQGMPDISSDGLTYTFHMRHDVKFSNGDPVTSADVLYSWNRAARLNDAYGVVFQPVVGYAAISASTPTATTLSGLSAPDQYTVVAKLTKPAGYWLSEVGLWTMDVVDKKVIPSDTDKTWWTTAATAIGTGPFKLTAYVPKDHLSFANVPNWWGGSTGHLTDVEATVLADQGSEVTKYQAGGFDTIGTADTYPPLDAVRSFQANPATKSQFVNIPGGRSTWVGFNFTKGPFAPAAGNLADPVALAGRRAFSEAIDRNQLVNVACGPGGIVCKPATGSVIPKGLHSYLGDNTDPTSVFNPTKAKADLATWDPTGTKQKGLVYWFNTTTSNTAIAGNLQSQWQTNLGVHVDTQATDFPTFVTNRDDKKYILFRGSWGADYDNPQDWFDNLWICSQAAVGLGNDEGICDPQIDAAVKKAESETGSQSFTDYQTATKQLISDIAVATIEYGANQYFIKPYVQGGGGNALYDNSWTSISILAH